MTEFLNAETHTRVLLMDYLQSLQEVRIWVNTVLNSLPERPKLRDLSEDPQLQGLRAEDVLAESYFVQKILVI